MRLLNILLLLLALACSTSSLAQLKLVQATAQPWAGGIAGMSGVNYTFSIACPRLSANFQPDTLWIGADPIPLTIRKSDQEWGNTTIKTSGKSVRMEIVAKTSRNDQNRLPGAKMTENQPPMPYKGVALLGYKQHNKQRYFLISRITRQLPSLSYP